MKRFLLLLLLLFAFNDSYSQASNYGFSAVSGSYSSLTGTTNIVGLDDTSDEAISAPTNIGFTFVFAGVNYTQFKVSSNGWITFNTSV